MTALADLLMRFTRPFKIGLKASRLGSVFWVGFCYSC